MPELPEVETIKQGLKSKIIGKTIADVEILHPKSFIGDKTKIINSKIADVKRVAKVLIIKLDNNLSLLIHLKMTGQVIFKKRLDAQKPYSHKPKSHIYDVDILPNKYSRVIIYFTDNTHLVFNDLRIFGWIKVVSSKELKKELANFSGLEPMDENFTFGYLQKIFSKTARAIKLVLMDQAKIGGIGNIYANEALFCAKIDPRKPTNKLTNRQIKSLRACLISVLNKAIQYQGTSTKDESFRDVNGKQGRMQNHLMVYGKEGKNCPNCKGKIKRIKIGSRSTYFCPKCQK